MQMSNFGMYLAKTYWFQLKLNNSKCLHSIPILFPHKLVYKQRILHFQHWEILPNQFRILTIEELSTKTEHEIFVTEMFLNVHY